MEQITLNKDIFSTPDDELELALDRDDPNFESQFKEKCRVTLSSRQLKDGTVIYSILAEIRKGRLAVPLVPHSKKQKQVDSSLFSSLIVRMDLDPTKLKNQKKCPYRIYRAYAKEDNLGVRRPFYVLEVLLYKAKSIDAEGEAVEKVFTMTGFLNGSNRDFMNDMQYLPKEKEIPDLGYVRTNWEIFLSPHTIEKDDEEDEEDDDY